MLSCTFKTVWNLSKTYICFLFSHISCMAKEQHGHLSGAGQNSSTAMPTLLSQEGFLRMDAKHVAIDRAKDSSELILPVPTLFLRIIYQTKHCVPIPWQHCRELALAIDGAWVRERVQDAPTHPLTTLFLRWVLSMQSFLPRFCLNQTGARNGQVGMDASSRQTDKQT